MQHIIQMKSTFLSVSIACTGGVDVNQMVQHTELTARIAKEGLSYEESETRITSTNKESGSSEKSGHETEVKRSMLQ